MATATKERKKTSADGIVLDRLALKAALKSVSLAKPPRNAPPVLRNVLLSGGALTGSDGDVRIDVTVENAPPGLNVLLPRDRLDAILEACTADEIRLVIGDTTTTIKAGTSSWTLPTEDVAEYPPWDVSGLKSLPRLPADQFVRAVRGVVFAVDEESSRYALGAVLIEVHGEKVTLVATDGRRLSSVSCEHGQAIDDTQTLVPARAMSIVSKLAVEAGNGSVQLEATTNELVATVGHATVTARLMGGLFPRWRDVVPKREAKATTVDRAALLSATRAAAICSSEDSKGVKYIFADEIALHGQSSERGESSVKCEVVEAGEKCTVKLDPKFVEQWLNGIASDAEPNVKVKAFDAQSAVVLRCGDNTGVIMPLAAE